MALNPKQEKFCLEYSKRGNATEAYRTAYGVVNESTAAANSSKLLRNAKIQSRLKELADELSSEKIMDAREVQERLTAIARGEVTEEIFLNGERTQRQATIRDKLKSIELLCRVQGLFIQRVDANINAAIPIVISGGDQLQD